MTLLYKEFNYTKNKFIFFRKKYFSFEIYEEINNLYQKIKNKKKGLVSICTKDKINFIIQFYALNRAGFTILINDKNQKNHILTEKVNINYYFKQKKLVKLNSKKNQFKNEKVSIILKTSGTTNLHKYVYISDQSISFISKNMNKIIYKKKEKFNELVFAPLEHAFAFGRMHALIKSKNSIYFPENYSISNFFNYLEKFKDISGLSITAGFLSKILNLKTNKINNIFKNVKYIQSSSSFFPINLRKKIINRGIKLFLNYGMTEAMRTTFLDCKSNPSKINTEGRVFNGVKIKISNSKNSNIGEILIKGRNLAKGYSNSNDWNSKIENGWFKTGDIGYLDKDNYLIYKKRKSDLLNINDINYSKLSIENLIKKKFKIKFSHIINKNAKLYLFVEKKINKNNLYKFLRTKNISLFFEKIIFSNKIDVGSLGKIKFKKYLKLING